MLFCMENTGETVSNVDQFDSQTSNKINHLTNFSIGDLNLLCVKDNPYGCL